MGAVAEHRPRAWHPPARPVQHRKQGLPAETTEGHHHAQPRAQKVQLGRQPGPAGVAFPGSGLVGRGRAVHGRGEPHPAQGQAVPGVDGGRLGGDPHVVQRGEEEVTGRVAREHAAGPVAAVRGGREPDHRHRRVRGSEPGHGPPPVLLVLEGGALHLGDLLPPGDQPGTGPAPRDEGVQLTEAGAPRGVAGRVAPVAVVRAPVRLRVVHPSTLRAGRLPDRGPARRS